MYNSSSLVRAARLSLSPPPSNPSLENALLLELGHTRCRRRAIEPRDQGIRCARLIFCAAACLSAALAIDAYLARRARFLAMPDLPAALKLLSLYAASA